MAVNYCSFVPHHLMSEEGRNTTTGSHWPGRHREEETFITTADKEAWRLGRIPLEAQDKWILMLKEIRYSPKVLFG